MISPKRWILLLIIAVITAYSVSSSLRPAPVAAACKAGQCKATTTPKPTATAVPTRTRTAGPTPTFTPSPTATSTATFTPSATPTPTFTPSATATPSATPTSTATLLSTSMTPWYLPDPTGNVSTVNATMLWDDNTNQSGPLPTGTLTAIVYDATCPTTGCIYTHTLTSSDYQWAFVGVWDWSIHYAFSLGTEYASTDAFWISYSGDSMFAGSTAQAIDT
jgi:hypothetical protein